MPTLESLQALRNDLVMKFTVGAIFLGDPSAQNINDLFNTNTSAAAVARTVADAATTAASTTVTSATAAFVAGDVGTAITGAGIPAGATIASVTSATTAVLSVAATATATAVSITFGAHAAVVAGATLQALPTGYESGGIQTQDGITLNRNVTISDTMSWQSTEITRSDTDMDQTQFQFILQQTSRVSLALSENKLLSEVGALGTGVKLDRATSAIEPLRKMLILSRDTQNDVTIGRFFPRCKITAHDPQKWARSTTLDYGFTVTSYLDPTYGTSQRFFIGGAGWLAYS